MAAKQRTRQGSSAGIKPASARSAATAAAAKGKPPTARRSAANDTAAKGKPRPAAAGRAGARAGGAAAVADTRQSANGRAAQAQGSQSPWRRLVRWAGGGLPLTTLVLSVLGLADATYLTVQHFTAATSLAGCSAHGAENCIKVTTSPESHIAGIPVSVLGLAFFAFMVAANSPWGWRARTPAVHWMRLGSVVAGIGLVLYLIYAELFLIGAICLYCTGVHIVTFLLFGLVITSAARRGIRGVAATS